MDYSANNTACFAGTRLEALLALQQCREVTSIITVPDSRVHQHLESIGQQVELVTKDSKPQAFDFLAGQEASMVLSVGFPYIIPGPVLNSGPLFINSHPSLLPAYKGSNAIKEAFNASEEYMGVTVHHMVAEVDAGPVIYQKRISVHGMELSEIYDSLFGSVEPDVITEAISRLKMGNHIRS